MKRFLFALVGSIAAMTGCGASDDSSDPPAASDDNLSEAAPKGVDAGTEHPEVGLLLMNNRYCTATLVDRRVALTAASCVPGESRPARQPNERFVVLAQDGSWHSYPVRQMVKGAAWATAAPAQIIYIQLESQVAPNVVPRVAPLAKEDPTEPTKISIYGFGCVAGKRGEEGDVFAGDWKPKKERFDLTWSGYDLPTYGAAKGTSPCKGDSGGPALGPSGEILRVTSSEGDAGIDNGDRVPRNGSVALMIDELKDLNPIRKYF